jgi:hypothetical protein
LENRLKNAGFTGKDDIRTKSILTGIYDPDSPNSEYAASIDDYIDPRFNGLHQRFARDFEENPDFWGYDY